MGEVGTTVISILQMRKQLRRVINDSPKITELVSYGPYRAHVCCFHAHTFTSLHLHKYICILIHKHLDIETHTHVHTQSRRMCNEE